MRLWFIAALIILLNSVYVYGLVINEIINRGINIESK